ncbi:MAG: sugar phosphate isomerase/epimerase [Actinomycetaceae bacterium]|nr:sugar phosphate isomerase/epimerase [Actinomycetaceae bacterium]
MKLGLVSAILDDATYEEMIDIAAGLGLACVEVACWPRGEAERRYAGVAYIDVERVLADDAYARHVVDYARTTGVEISSLAFYPNPLDPDAAKREATIAHLKNVIRASAKLGVGMVTTFIGRDQHKTVEDNLRIVEEVWPPIVELAEASGVRIGLENCPMLFGPDQWPGGHNLMTTPDVWSKVFEILPSRSLGINYDPSHFVWQMIDYIAPLYEFADRIVHVHFKDIKLYEHKLNQVGIMAYPLEYMAPKIPGLGDVDWGAYVSALTDIGYEGCACIEIEDRAFEGSRERVLDSIRLSKRYMEQFVV